MNLDEERHLTIQNYPTEGSVFDRVSEVEKKIQDNEDVITALHQKQ